MPMMTCQPGHRLYCRLVLYGLQDVRNSEARNRSTMRTLAKTARLSPVRLAPRFSPQFLAFLRIILTPRGPSTGIYLDKPVTIVVTKVRCQPLKIVGLSISFNLLNLLARISPILTLA